ncbi:DUF2797 domain-containing protein [Streptacidiphilus sp. PAMC 29251]
MSAWHCTGMRWATTGPALTWSSPTGGEQESRLPLPGGPLAFTVTGERRCVGIWRNGRRLACPLRTEIAGRTTNPLCPDCAALDRRHSIAADTALDDPRPFHLYLAWFGPDLVKVGITAAERGRQRLLQQGALAHTWLGQGRIAGVRRTEAALGAALQLPDRMSHARKVTARSIASRPGQAAAELAACHHAAQASTAWPETVTRLPFTAQDHLAAYHHDRARPLQPDRAVGHLAPDDTVAGDLVAVVGPDAYLAGEDGVLLLDLRLLAGWPLAKAQRPRTTAATSPLPRSAPDEAQHGLF